MGGETERVQGFPGTKTGEVGTRISAGNAAGKDARVWPCLGLGVGRTADESIEEHVVRGVSD